MKSKFLLSLFCVLLLVPACITEPDDTPEHLLKSCFNAIKKNDWNKFKPLVVTMADILQKEMNIKVSRFKQRLSYTGGVLRPEQMKEMKKRFDRAHKGGAGIVNFGDYKFAGIGTLLAGNPRDPESRGIYSLELKGKHGKIDTKDSFPYFEIMPWEGKWRIIALIFPGDFSRKAQEK